MRNGSIANTYADTERNPGMQRVSKEEYNKNKNERHTWDEKTEPLGNVNSTYECLEPPEAPAWTRCKKTSNLQVSQRDVFLRCSPPIVSSGVGVSQVEMAGICQPRTFTPGLKKRDDSWRESLPLARGRFAHDLGVTHCIPRALGNALSSTLTMVEYSRGKETKCEKSSLWRYILLMAMLIGGPDFQILYKG